MMMDDHQKAALDGIRKMLKDARAKKFATKSPEAPGGEEKKPVAMEVSIERHEAPAESPAEEAAESPVEEAHEDEAAEHHEEPAAEKEAPLPEVHKSSLAILRALRPAAKKPGSK